MGIDKIRGCAMINSLKKTFTKVPRIMIDSFKVAFAILGGLGILLNFTSFSLINVGELNVQIGLVVLVYTTLFIGTLFVKSILSKSVVSLNIRGIKIIIKEGNILESTGWKLIPFNEYFDTQVDDVVIAHSSLNGKFIDSLGDDEKNALEFSIANDNSSPLNNYKSSDGKKTKYELGTIKVYKDVMMLALTHFNDQNEAHTSRAEYEHTLRKMWKEICRAYQGRSINIPLIGGGLTRLDDITEKPNQQLLNCILCTLRTSTVTFDENIQITIFLTKKALESVNLYELKGVEKS